METRLIVVANSARASVFSSKDKLIRKPLALVTTLSHPDSRKKRSDLLSDRSGHYNTHGSKKRGAYEDNIDPKLQEAELFAKLIAQYLEDSNKRHAYEEVDVIMPNHFWELLAKHLSTQVSQKICHFIPKDLTLMPEMKVREALH